MNYKEALNKRFTEKEFIDIIQENNIKEIYEITKYHLNDIYIDKDKCYILWTIYELLNEYYKTKKDNT